MHNHQSITWGSDHRSSISWQTVNSKLTRWEVRACKLQVGVRTVCTSIYMRLKCRQKLWCSISMVAVLLKDLVINIRVYHWCRLEMSWWSLWISGLECLGSWELISCENETRKTTARVIMVIKISWWLSNGCRKILQHLGQILAKWPFLENHLAQPLLLIWWRCQANSQQPKKDRFSPQQLSNRAVFQTGALIQWQYRSYSTTESCLVYPAK